jgi:hypothetical protein
VVGSQWSVVRRENKASQVKLSSNDFSKQNEAPLLPPLLNFEFRLLICYVGDRPLKTDNWQLNQPLRARILSLCVLPKEPTIRRPAAMQMQESATLKDGQAYSLT